MLDQLIKPPSPALAMELHDMSVGEDLGKVVEWC